MAVLVASTRTWPGSTWAPSAGLRVSMLNGRTLRLRLAPVLGTGALTVPLRPRS